MKLIQVIFAITFLLYTVTGFAARQDKTLICHVGNELGPGGEEYDPACVPEESNDYFCADAGKVDLILVAKANKHLDNASHEYDGLSDYVPSEVGASGVGMEDSDLNGIDDGCEIPVDSACPCWSSAEIAEVGNVLTNQGDPNNSPANWCFGSAPNAALRLEWTNVRTPDLTTYYNIGAFPTFNLCQFSHWGWDSTPTFYQVGRGETSLTEEENSACLADVQKLRTDFDLCSPP